MARISQVAAKVDRASGSTLIEILQETRTFAPIRFNQPGVVPKERQAVSGWSFELSAEVGVGIVEASRVDPLRLMTVQPAFRAPTVAHNSSETGRVDFLMQPDIYPGRIELDATEIPILICYLRLIQGPDALTAPIDMMRVLVAIRRGKPDGG